jgi:uncharacterized integral membrane protein
VAARGAPGAPVAIVDDHDVRAEGRREGPVASGRLIITGLVILALVFFVGQNTASVDIKWLFFEGDAPLWLMLVLSALAGAIIALGVSYTLRRRNRD